MAAAQPNTPETFEIELYNAFKRAVEMEIRAVRRAITDAKLAFMDAAYALEEQTASNAQDKLSNTPPGEPSLLEDELEDASQEWACAENCLEALYTFENRYLPVSTFLEPRYIHSDGLKQVIASITPDEALQKHLLQRLFERARQSGSALYTPGPVASAPDNFKIIINPAFAASLTRELERAERNARVALVEHAFAAREAHGVPEIQAEIKHAKSFAEVLELFDRINVNPPYNLRPDSSTIKTLDSAEIRTFFASAVKDEVVQERLTHCVFNAARENKNRAALYI